MVRASVAVRPTREVALADEPLIAVFVDFENLAIGARKSRLGGLRIELVLKRLLEKGRIVFKRAYCDWSHYREEVREFHRHGIEMVDVPQTAMSGKNSADIRMVVDALDLCYAKEHIDIFVLLSGDSDFSPLVQKLKENDKRVIACGVKASTSDLLIGASDEFIYYDDLVRAAEKPKRAPPRAPARKGKPKDEKGEKRDEAVELVMEIIRGLDRDYDQVWGSMIKQAVRRVHPGFNEEYHGYESFAAVLEDLAERGLLELEYDEKRGNYLVRVRAARPKDDA
jgi:uncharacterized protein (TIGR00288 family)